MPGRGRRVARFVFGRNPRITLVRTALLAAATWIVFREVLLVVRVQGTSMEPTVRERGLRLVSLWAYRDREPETGDIVVIAMAGRRAMLLKRVLAVPGECIRFRGGALLVDGAPRPEPYVARRGDWSTAEYLLQPGEYYVAGDNRGTPIEEHETGIVERERIVGRLLL